jgi:hypothetical protein
MVIWHKNFMDWTLDQFGMVSEPSILQFVSQGFISSLSFRENGVNPK